MERLPELKVDQLRALAAVEHHGGFSKAARALGKTQSSISQAVAQLEEDVGELLVLREGRRTRLTDTGRVVVEHAQRVMDALEEARQALARTRGAASGNLTLGTSDTFALYLLPKVLAEFRRRHPNIELRLDNRPSPALAVAVAERAVDLAIVSLPLPASLRAEGKPVHDRIELHTQQAVRDVVVVPWRHGLASRPKLSYRQLATEPLVLLDRSTSARAFHEAAFVARGLRPRVVLEVNSIEVIKRLVLLGFGASVLPELAINAEVQKRQLRAIPLADAPTGRAVGLVVPKVGPSHAARTFAALYEELRGTLVGPGASGIS